MNKCVTVTCPVCTRPRAIASGQVRAYKARPHGFRCRSCSAKQPRPGRVGKVRSMCRHCTKVSVNRPRGLCWGCYYTPGVKELYPATGKYNRRSDVNMTPAAARLALWSALLYAGSTGRASRWRPEDWDRFVARLSPRQLVVVALHGVRGMTFAEISAWLGVSKSRVDQNWRSALVALGPAAEAEVA